MLAERIRELLKKRRMTQQELAAQSGVSFNTIQSYLQKKVQNPQVDAVVKIADALGVSVDYLLGRTTDADIKARYIAVDADYNVFMYEVAEDLLDDICNGSKYKKVTRIENILVFSDTAGGDNNG